MNELDIYKLETKILTVCYVALLVSLVTFGLVISLILTFVKGTV